MKYSELMDSETKESGTLEYQIGGGAVAVTIRVPASLRDYAKEAAAQRDMSLGACVHNCMIQELSKRS